MNITLDGYTADDAGRKNMRVMKITGIMVVMAEMVMLITIRIHNVEKEMKMNDKCSSCEAVVLRMLLSSIP